MKIRNARCFTGKTLLEKASVDCDTQVRGIQVAERCTQGIDLQGMFLLPGFVDTHIHGANGYDTCDATEQALCAIETFLFSEGVTSFLPTTLSVSQENILSVLHIVRELRAQNPSRSICGVHLEGPYVNPQKAGAQNPAFIRNPSEEEIQELLSFDDIVRIVTLAPEIPGALGLVKQLVERGIHVSIGHTCAGDNECSDALALGADRFTHLFNAMDGVHHRQMGAAGWGLLSDAYVEVICDGVHLSRSALQLVFTAKDPGKIVFISDAMRAKGLQPGKYTLGDLAVMVSERDARLENGALAGSILSMDRALSNMARWVEQPLERLFACCTINPATSAGIRAGRIDIGWPADFVVLDTALRVVATIKAGELVYGELA
ncbi:MAG TPA: N-acetylglucosamine-6-phosphate deacetylase [Thermotogota bacterium]|mgnify:CR=1 FL=1|nr:N-acetylglucosamine-6-phosphate deacetylase [Thermotogota bacterium]